MADKDNKFEDNVPGKFYVDEQCIACDACVNEAPDHFELDDDDGHSWVKKQPASPEEEEACKAALEACPVEAIGDDGSGDKDGDGDSGDKEEEKKADAG